FFGRELRPGLCSPCGMSEALLEIDGSFGEGGGQILRTSLALALLTGRGFHLRNVRARRPKPGLQPQHLMSVRAAATVGNAATRGASLGSSDLVFEPGQVRGGKYRFDIGTAGATGLVLHTLYLPLALRGEVPSELTLTGGTHVSTSPCYHFLDVTWRRYLEACGLRARLRMVRPGFYPRGGGVVEAFVQPCPRLHGLRLRERGPVRATGFSAVAGLDVSIAKRQARRAAYRLGQQGVKATFREETWEGGPGTVLAVELDTAPAPTLFFALGARGKPAERVADEAVDQAVAYLEAGPALVDEHSADQLVLPLALAEGPSEYTTARVTTHLTTNVAVIRRFIERDIVCEGEEGGPGRVRIT
ncbi:MAG TPA: RNA 3'-terminal phosphate cyclase, partial [Gemmataceae bacterium]|nr:RNA 3'-terminal phosphate cyclase [Gemmataceae bacterium]